MSEIIFRCSICEQTWTDLPEGAIQLTTKRGGSGLRITYKFPDNSIHVIKQTARKAKEK